MTRETAVILTLCAYNVLLIGIGLAARRRTRDGSEFFLGGRQLGPIVASLSASASSSSAWTLLGVSGAAYAWGLSAVWIFPACVGGFALNWYVLAPRLRRTSHSSGALTVTEVLASGSGRRLRRLTTAVASLIVLASLAAYVAAQYHGAAKTFHETFHISMTASIVLGGGIVLLYTLLGGFWAVSLTDTLQGLVMAASATILPIAAIASVGGPAGLVDGLHSVTDPGYLSLIGNVEEAGGVGFVLGLLGIGLGYPGQPHVVNRFMALRPGARELRVARRTAVVWAATVYAGMLVVGWCGRLLYPELVDREAVFVNATNALLHPVLSGVLLAAVLSAVMSTADSQLLVAASVVTHDLGLGGRTQRDVVRRSRLVVLLLCAGAMVAALTGPADIFDRVLFAWTAMGAAFGPALLVTVFGRPISPTRTILAMVLGSGLSVVFYYTVDSRAIQRVVPVAVAFAVILVRWPRPFRAR